MSQLNYPSLSRVTAMVVVEKGKDVEYFGVEKNTKNMKKSQKRE